MILNFDEIKKEDVLIAGGKGANLGEMTSAKINVPRGFVITADAYRALIFLLKMKLKNQGMMKKLY